MVCQGIKLLLFGHSLLPLSVQYLVQQHITMAHEEKDTSEFGLEPYLASTLSNLSEDDQQMILTSHNVSSLDTLSSQ